MRKTKEKMRIQLAQFNLKCFLLSTDHVPAQFLLLLFYLSPTLVEKNIIILTFDKYVAKGKTAIRKRRRRKKKRKIW
jgi:hypothetical protein